MNKRVEYEIFAIFRIWCIQVTPSLRAFYDLFKFSLNSTYFINPWKQYRQAENALNGRKNHVSFRLMLNFFLFNCRNKWLFFVSLEKGKEIFECHLLQVLWLTEDVTFFLKIVVSLAMDFHFLECCTVENVINLTASSKVAWFSQFYYCWVLWSRNLTRDWVNNSIFWNTGCLIKKAARWQNVISQ